MTTSDATALQNYGSVKHIMQSKGYKCQRMYLKPSLIWSLQLLTHICSKLCKITFY